METTLRGLLECPFQSGYVEFTYEPGDLVSELRKEITQAWTDLVAERSRHIFRNRGWVFLCQDENRAYVRMEDNDHIPTRPAEVPTLDVVDIPEPSRVAVKYNSMMFLHWDSMFEVLPRNRDTSRYGMHEDRFRLNLDFERSYCIPDDNNYAVRFVVLPALAGG